MRLKNDVFVDLDIKCEFPYGPGPGVFESKRRSDNSLAEEPPSQKSSLCTSMLNVYILEWPKCDMNKPIQRASRPGVSQEPFP